MGPRLARRGMPFWSLTDRLELELQWVHGSLAVVCLGTRGRPPLRDAWLQWVHGSLAVVCRLGPAAIILGDVASMGPRLARRGMRHGLSGHSAGGDRAS